MDDVQDEVDTQSEIDSLISKSITSIDDAEIEAELDALIGQTVTDLPQVPITNVDLPDVPTDIAEDIAPEREMIAA